MRQFPAIGAALMLVFAAACSADEGTGPEEASADAPANAAANPAPIVVAEATETPAAPEATTGDFDPNRFQAGKHYTILTPAQPTSVGPDQVEVVEVFWYGCPHCYTLEPFAERWAKSTKPEGTEFVKMPAALNPNWQVHARLFYAAETLGVLDKVHGDIFREIHVNRNPLNTEDLMVAFFDQHGVSREDFLEAWNSFAVETNLKRAGSIVRRYRLTGVPAVVVNGKYVTGADKAGGNEAVFEVVNFLVEKEKRRL